MLNKKICQKCHKKWSKEDEKDWKKLKSVTCTMEPKNDDFVKFLKKMGGKVETVQVTGIEYDPPEWCPYALEHVVSEKS